MKKRTSIIIGIIALILDQLTKVLFINKNMELIPNVLKIYYWQNEGTIFEITNGINIKRVNNEIIKISSMTPLFSLLLSDIKSMKSSINFLHDNQNIKIKKSMPIAKRTFWKNDVV